MTSSTRRGQQSAFSTPVLFSFGHDRRRQSRDKRQELWGREWAFSSPEAGLVLVSTKNRDLAVSNSGSPRFTDFPSLCACSESSLTNLIGSGLNLLCLQIHSKPECRWTWPEVAILGADQQERGLWRREWRAMILEFFCACPVE